MMKVRPIAPLFFALAAMLTASPCFASGTTFATRLCAATVLEDKTRLTTKGLVKDTPAAIMAKVLDNDRNLARRQELSETEGAFIVRVYSLSIDPAIIEALAGMINYEKRGLWSASRPLRNPKDQLVYITSQKIDPVQLEAEVWGPMKSMGASQEQIASVKKRVHFLSVDDLDGKTPLAKKLVQPRNQPVVQEIKKLVDQHNATDRVIFETFTVTELEANLQNHLSRVLNTEVPIVGNHWANSQRNTKTANKQAFEGAGIRHAKGYHNLDSEADFVDAVYALNIENPQRLKFVLKQNDGVSGMGNAVIKFDRPIDPHMSPDAAKAMIRKKINKELDTTDGGISIDDFLKTLYTRGGVVEEWIRGEVISSPSIQLDASTGRMLSTHDQILNGQEYLGAKGPITWHRQERDEFGKTIVEQLHEIGEKVLQQEQSKGTRGVIAIDTVVSKVGDDYRVYAIETNIREGGTTHPLRKMEYYYNSIYDPEKGVFREYEVDANGNALLDNGKYQFKAGGAEYHYHVLDKLYIKPARVEDMEHFYAYLNKSNIFATADNKEGVLMHMSGLHPRDHGRMGYMAVAKSPEKAEAIAKRFEKLVTAYPGQ